MTLINISAVEGWFDPSRQPKSAKKRSVLLVPCARHCKISDMNLEQGTWLRDVTYERSDGETEHFRAGEPVGALMKGWRNALLEFSKEERDRVFEVIDIWGQPRAWTDELIASWTIDFIKDDDKKCPPRPRSRRPPPTPIPTPAQWKRNTNEHQ